MMISKQLRPTLRATTAAAFAVALALLASGCTPSPAPAESPRKPDVGFALSTDWLDADERPRVEGLDLSFTDQAGVVGRLGELVDRPTLITFFYTRCQNNYKCSATVSQLAHLQAALVKAGIENKVRLLAITFEPHFDTPERIARYGSNRGFQFTATARGLVLEPEGHTRLLAALDTPVGFNAGWVNTHGVALDVLDAKARFVRRYHTVLWSNQKVLADARRLLRE